MPITPVKVTKIIDQVEWGLFRFVLPAFFATILAVGPYMGGGDKTYLFNATVLPWLRLATLFGVTMLFWRAIDPFGPGQTAARWVRTLGFGTVMSVVLFVACWLLSGLDVLGSVGVTLGAIATWTVFQIAKVPQIRQGFEERTIDI